MTAFFQNILKEPHIKQLIGILADHHVEARIVGGAVRDALLGLPINDIDIAAAAPPHTIGDILKEHAHVIPTGIKHGTVTVVFKENIFQITSLRRDVTTFGRHADVCYGTSFEEDAHRRDFTINALYLDGDGHLYDYFKGVDDLKFGLVRFIGDPHARITEDYLRILRYFRMHVSFGKVWHQESLDACASLAQGMEMLSRERIRHEFFKILTVPDCFKDVSVMAEKGILTYVAPRLAFDIKAFERFLIQEQTHNLNIDPLYRLYALYHDQSPSFVTNDFVLTRHERDLWRRLQDTMNTDFLVAELLYCHGRPFTQAFLCLYEAITRHLSDVPWDKLHSLTTTAFPLKAMDLQALGYEGKILGDALKFALRYWCKKDFKPTQNDLLTFLGQYNKITPTFR
ncbi:MAG: hypothetical protein K2X98_01015 [Alphaproteobacteria bacterium]|nr:hypothetical protein [Alphaproteobacteria bacterium]